MTALLAAVAAAAVLTGLLLGVQGVRKTPVQLAAPSRRPTTMRTRFARLDRRTRLLLTAGAAAGLVIALLTGWLVAIAIVPLAAAGIPWALSDPAPKARIARLEAMEEWTRSLSGVLVAGAGIEQALIATLRSTPTPIRPEISTLVARLRARWTSAAALRALADDLNDATGDLVAANLILAVHLRGEGLASVLEGLAESVAAEVRARRDIENDRGKLRTRARWITIITVGFLALLALDGTYIQPYGTPLGQVLLAVLLSLYAAVLIWTRQMAKGDELPRFIGHAVAERITP